MSKERKPFRWSRFFRRLILLVILLAVIAAAAFFFYRTMQAKYAVSYTPYKANNGSITNALSFSGNMAVVDAKAYTAESTATVRTLYVSAGDRVSKGDRLMRLSNGETVKADFDGTINTLDVQKDEEVTPGTTLCQLVDFAHMTVAIRIDEYDIGSVRLGDDCKVIVTATGETFASRIGKINYVSSSTGNVASYAASCDVVSDGGVYPGMQATVTLPKESAENVVVLKLDAISFDEANQACVWKEKPDGTMERVYVTVGVSNGNYVEIKSGVESGETVYAVKKKTTDTSVAGMFSSLFSAPTGGQTNRNRNNNGYGNGGQSYQPPSSQNGGAPGGGAPNGGAR